jgi:hypothetical protein
MKYLLTIYSDESRYATMTPADSAAMLQAYGKVTEEMRASGAYLSGEGLQPTATATTVRVSDGETLLTDGPFAETREQLGGFYLLECADLDEANRWAAKVAGASAGAIEVRPVMDYESANGAPVEAQGAAQGAAQG